MGDTCRYVANRKVGMQWRSTSTREGDSREVLVGEEKL